MPAFNLSLSSIRVVVVVVGDDDEDDNVFNNESVTCVLHVNSLS